MATTVQRYPGDLKLQANAGYIEVVANDYLREQISGFIEIESGSYLSQDIGGYVENKFGGYLSQDISSYNENKIGQYQLNEIASYQENQISDRQVNTIGSYQENNISSYVLSDIGDYSDTTVGSYLRYDVGDYAEYTISGYLKNDVGGSIENISGSFMKNDIAGYIENISTDYLFNNISGYISNQSGSYIENQTGDYFSVQAGSYIDNQSGSYYKVDAGSYIEQLAGATIKLDAGSDFDVISGGTFKLDAGSNAEFTVGSDVTFTVSGDYLVDAATITLGTARTQFIDTQASFINDIIPSTSSTYNLGSSTSVWNNLHVDFVKSYSTQNVGNPYLRPYDPLDVYGAAPGDLVAIAAANAARETSGNFFRGGVGIQQDLNVGGFIYGRIEIANTSSSVQVTATNIDQVFYPTLSLSTGNQFLFIDTVGQKGGFTYNPAQGLVTADRGRISATDQSSSSVTGAFTVSGGVGIAKDVYIGGDVLPGSANTSSIGNPDLSWISGYIDNLYTRALSNTNSDITVTPGTGLTDIFGDIRVRGTNPIGTAPIVRNTLYVTMDGNDTNDGRAQDASRACRTIGGAMKSPYYQEGTQILVSAGHYLEDNPLPMKRYTSVRGSDIRTTFIEPINKTQDLFYVNSGCYLNYMTFLNGRSGLLEGPYEQGFNRGAYCTAFPPLEGDERIDLNQSPYIQNCTNQSGPWLKDGTMFIPNQTVQVPAAIGTGTWAANTTSIVVKVENGTIARGMSINAGQQNPGYYDARTLLLANKPFIQDQVVAYVDQTFNSGNFVYDVDKCRRDTGLILDSIATDLIQDSLSESIFAGLQYWRQSGYVDAIGGQITTTTAAINYLKNLATATVATAAEKAIVSARFDNILEVINTSTATLVTGAFSEWVTNNIVSNGTASSTASVLTAYNALLAAKTTLTNQTISYINGTLTPFTYDAAKCSRDTGLIVDSIVLDLLHGGSSQSIFAGIQYWNQTGVLFPAELTTTTNAIKYLGTLTRKIIVGDTTAPRYQTAQVQQFSPLGLVGTAAEQATITSEFNTIVNILTSGTLGVSDLIVPNGITTSTNQAVVNSYNLIQLNKNYLINEVLAYVEATKSPGFTYSSSTCARDVGYIIDSISFDLLYGGNKQAIQSGVYYYGYNASSTAIPGEIPQTTAAYKYMKELFAKVIKGRPIPSAELYQTGTPQVVSLISGTDSEVDTAQDLLDTIISIINNGPNGLIRSPIPLNRLQDQFRRQAAELLNANRSFIRAEVIAYVNTLKTFVYDEDLCRRDIGYIIDSVAYDLKHGGNKQSIKSGVYYFGYSTNTTEIPGEIPQTYAAYKFLKNIVSNVVLGVNIATKYQSSQTQILNLNSATVYEVESLGQKIDVITDIIRNGPEDYSTTGARIPINLTANTNTGVVNAYNLIKANKNFIVAETIAYINTTSNSFDYNREKCRRDVGILVENISYDAVYGGNQKAVESGLSYYDGVISRISGQEAQTIAAIDYLNEISQKVIVNATVTDLLSGTGTYAQVKNIVLNGSIASDAIDNLFNIVTTIIDNGPSAAPEIYSSPGPDQAFISAQTLIQANRKYIQENTIQYINRVLIPTSYPTYFSYSERKCRRDTGIIIDSIALDLLYPTQNQSQSTFAGLQYWSQVDYVPGIKNEINPTISAITYLKDLSKKIILNITPTDDLINRYQTATSQVTNLEPATTDQADILANRFDEILEIMNGTIIGWTDRIVPNGKPSDIISFQNAFNLLIANKNYLAQEVNAFVTATNYGFVYDSIKCRRDVGYITEAVAFDLLHGGNRQSIQNGLYYFGFTTSTNIYAETTQTVAAFNSLSNIVSQVVRNIPVTARQSKVSQVFGTTTATIVEAQALGRSITTITNIIQNGPSIAVIDTPVALTASNTLTVLTAYDLLIANRDFLVEETIAYIDQTFNPGLFNYDESKCYRDIGLVLDAVSQDIVLGGNSKSIEAGLSYWTNGYNAVAKELTTTTMAFNFARNMALEVAKNKPFAALTGTFAEQVINPFFQYGEEYGPQEAIKRNFKIINDIINKGPAFAPPNFIGGGLYALTGINGSDPLPEPKVVSVTTVSTATFLVGLDRPTIGFGVNATLYFGDTEIYPLRDYEVDELSYEYTGNTSTWALRKIDQVGGMGGALIDGAVISDTSPIQSFVFDAYTQLSQGGRGVHIKNDGYAQLVSVFTLFSSIGVEVESGGIASIVNSNANFGNICLQAKGYGKRKFSGHIYNPAFKAYPESPNIPGSEYLNQYYPSGFWPNNASVMVFLPDLDDRPHISLVMEVIPPETVRDFTGQLVPQLNEQNFPGFLNASPTTSTLTTGSIVLTGINTDGIYIGNAVYARDQFGRTTSTNVDSFGNWIPYVAPNTIVTNVEYQKVTLSQPLTSGGADPDNTANSVNENYFDLYFCGNAYYTVLSSSVANNPQYNKSDVLIPDGENILSAISLGLPVGQINEHIAALNHLNTITNRVISNQTVTSLQTGTNTTTQYINLLVQGGGAASTFIDLRFDDAIGIVGAANLTAAEAVVKPVLRTTTGPAVQGAGSAITLIEENIEFLADEVSAYVVSNFFSTNFASYSADERLNIIVKCQRDTKIILQRLIYDIQTGGRYNMVLVGLSYWRRLGSYHIVNLGEAVTRTDLFPDGATVNFYQRSYMSASGYVFEYVGAGIDYGALPQRGVSDPKQGQEVVQLGGGKVFFTSTDQNGDFRIGPGLVISQATGVLSGRTFTRSLFANLTPFILAIETGAG